MSIGLRSSNSLDDADLLSADDERIASAEGRLHLLDRAIELAMQILHAIGRHRGVRDLRLARLSRQLS